MTDEEISKLSQAMVAFCRGPNRAFLITNGSLETLVQEFSRRLTNASDRDAVLDFMVSNAALAAINAVSDAEHGRVVASFDGQTWPVLTENGAHALATACPENFEGH